MDDKIKSTDMLREGGALTARGGGGGFVRAGSCACWRGVKSRHHDRHALRINATSGLVVVGFCACALSLPCARCLGAKNRRRCAGFSENTCRQFNAN